MIEAVPVLVVGTGKIGPRKHGAVFGDIHQAIWGKVGQWLDQGRINKAENGNADAHSEREDEDGRECETKVVSKLSHRETQVLCNGFPGEGDQAVTLLAEIRCITELARGSEISLPWRCSTGNQFFFGLLTMEGHLFVKPENQADRMEQTVAWFDKYLKE